MSKDYTKHFDELNKKINHLRVIVDEYKAMNKKLIKQIEFIEEQDHNDNGGYEPRKWRGHPRSGMIPMPDLFEIFHGNVRCDMAQGPCSCRAGHSREDWVSRCKNKTMRYTRTEKATFRRLIRFIDAMERGEDCGTP